MSIKRIISLLIALAFLGGGIAFYLYNKPHEKVEDAKGLAVTSIQLCKDFATDEAKANATYTGKALEVSGIISEVKDNQDGTPVIILAGDNPSLSVQCTMRDKGVKAEPGNTLTVKGFFSSNDMFGPTLTDCVVMD